MTKIASLPPELLHVFEALPELYLILSPDQVILAASDIYLKITHKERKSLLGQYLFDVFPDKPATENGKSIDLRYSLNWVLENKKQHQIDLHRYDILNETGGFEEKYWQTINTPVLNNEGTIEYIIHKVIDITDQELSKKQVEKYEQQLRKVLGKQNQTETELNYARAEADLERKKLHNIFMQAPAMICIFEGPQHKFKLVNPLYQTLVGNRPIVGMPIAEAMPELAGQPIFDLLDQVYRTGESFYAHEMKVQLDHENTGGLGHNFYNFTYQAIRDIEDNIEGIMVFAYEVTQQVEARRKVEQREHDLKELNLQLKNTNAELQQTQFKLKDLNQELEQRVIERTKALQQSQGETEAQRNRLHQLFMEAPAPICILSGADFVYELVNPAYAQLFPGRDLLGKPILVALPEIKDNRVYKTFREVYNTGKTHEEQELLIPLIHPKTGLLEERYFRYIQQAHFDEHGNVDGVVVFALEITEQVEARKAVEASAKQLRLVTDSLPVLIGYLDKEEKYRFANKAYETWFPLKSEELLGRPVREVVGEKAYQTVKGYIDRALSGERLNYETKMPYREDFVKYIRTSYVPDMRDGVVEGFFTLVTDVTEQTEARLLVEEREKEALTLTRKLAATNEELTATNKQLIRTKIDLDNFIYTASHDLKAPIYNIEGLVNILLESITEETLATREMVRVKSMIEDSIARFKRTIEHLTEIIKLQKENNHEIVVVDLLEVINDVRLDLSPQLEAAGAKLTIDVDKCPAIRFSQKNLRSVVYNLLSNAIKYSSPVRKPDIKLNCYPDGAYVVLEVVDNGLGMNKAGRQKLFAMFSRLHDHVEGSGIGLYMVKRIVENADGRIEVESEPSVGSTFRVYFKS
ncbi:PAS domain S-box-containing protein [Pontibacter aydingkolensis]|uniref:histidine kinase n=1 Tax=Pontibacter aydingkolensis TaxID=1911536 RepID=A0ABS7CZ94_9BACT|nr:PAS domain-containing protein [Pontibacter aydingkolensis]MBW7469173.1 PAS domain-containing protein [Pontibacter aydingkolensis]